MKIKGKIPKELISPDMPEESVRADLEAELDAVVGDFEAWYFNRDDYRQAWIPPLDYEPKDKALTEDIRRKVKAQLKTAEELPSVYDEERIIKDLVGLVETWEDWYPNYKKVKDQYSWTYDAGENREIYEYSDYGDPEKSSGLGGVYPEEDEPFVNDELEVVFNELGA